jgi:hypothetical protein
MEVARIFETSVYANDTIWHYISEGSHLHTRRRENLKSHTITELADDIPK